MEGDLQQVLGRNVRMIRSARQVSQEKLAESLGVHRTYVGGIERGERNLTLRTVERLSHLLGADPIDLLTDRQAVLRAAQDGDASDARGTTDHRRPQGS